MRIAVWHNLPSGGGKRALYDHVQGLVARGHHVEAWCPPTADPTYLPLRSLIPEHVVSLAMPVPFRRSDEWQLTLKVTRDLAAMDAHLRQCAAEIMDGGFDVLFANTCLYFRTTAIGRHVALPSVLYLQEPYRWLYEALPRLCWLAPQQAPQYSLRNLRRHFVDWRNVRNWRVQARDEVDNAAAFTRILANSYFSRESILRAYGLDARVCYLGVDTGHFRDAGLPREGYVVGLGSCTPEKNIALAIEALGAMSEPRPPLVWVGNIANEDYRRAMTDLAVRRGVTVDFRIGISDAALTDVLGRAMAMIYAPRLEPFGLAPLEANACGVPVVAVLEGGVRETIRHQVNGLLSDPTPAALAQAVTHLRDDPDLARRLGNAGRRVVAEHWSVAAATERLERHLLDVASRHVSRGVAAGQPSIQPASSDA